MVWQSVFIFYFQFTLVKQDANEGKKKTKETKKTKTKKTNGNKL